ncbi:MAG: MFS transporter [Pyrinomonadaceae bacterium]
MAEAEKTSTIWQRYRSLSPTVFALSLVSFLNDTSSEIIYPLLPTFLALTLGASPFAIGLIEGFAESIASILKLFSGYLSDRFGNRKFPVFVGYSLAAVVRPLLSFVTSWPQVLFVRMTDRIGKGIRGAPRDALLAETVPEHARGLAFGFNRAADHLGAIVGPIVAFLLLTYLAADSATPTAREYQQVFLFASIPVALGLFVIVVFVREEKKPATEADEVPLKFSLRAFDPNFKRFLVVVSLFTLSNSTDAFLLLRAQETGIATAMLPLLWMVLHFSKFFSSIIGGDVSDKIGRKTMILTGWVIYAFVYAGFAFADSAWQAWTLFIVYGLYFGLTEGVEKALVADMVDDEKRGTAFGFYNLAYGITVFPASIIFGFVWSKFGAAPAFIMSAVISLIASACLLMIRARKS